jgi:uncharacterized protein
MLKFTFIERARVAGLLAAALIVAGVGVVSPAGAVDYAPVNCAKPGSAAVKAICSNYGLGQLEARMATLFEWTTSLVAMGQRGEIQDEQKAFLKLRDGCKANVNCIRDAYGVRIQQLETVMSRIREHGPF